MRVPSLNQQAGRAAGDLATLFLEWPEQNASAGQFFEALALFDEAVAEDPSSSRALIWPLWHRIDFLDVSRRAVTIFAEDMLWLESSEAGKIATRLASTFVVFPELALVVDKAKLAQEIGHFGSGPRRIFYLGIAYAIAPEDQWTVQNLLVELAEAGAEDLLLSFVDGNRFQQLDVALLRRVITAISTKIPQSRLSATLGRLAEKLEYSDEVAQLRLGLAIERAGRDRSSVGIDPVRLATAASRTRRLMASNRSALISNPANRVKADLAASIAKARQHLSGLMKKSNDTALPNPADRASSGIISWVEYKSTEGVRLYPLDLASEYGKRTGDEALAAQHHPGDAHFARSRFVLGPGSYEVGFWGTSVEGLKMIFSVVSDDGQVLARATILSVETSSDDSKLYELPFTVAQRAGMEISMLVGAGFGELRVSHMEVKTLG